MGTCHTCGYVSRVTEVFHDLLLPIPTQDHVLRGQMPRIAQPPKKKTRKQIEREMKAKKLAAKLSQSEKAEEDHSQLNSSENETGASCEDSSPKAQSDEENVVEDSANSEEPNSANSEEQALANDEEAPEVPVVTQEMSALELGERSDKNVSPGSDRNGIVGEGVGSSVDCGKDSELGELETENTNNSIEQSSENAIVGSLEDKDISTSDVVGSEENKEPKGSENEGTENSEDLTESNENDEIDESIQKEESNKEIETKKSETEHSKENNIKEKTKGKSTIDACADYRRGNIPPSNTLNLLSCLEIFTNPEILSDREAYNCISCTRKKYRQVQEKLCELSGDYSILLEESEIPEEKLRTWVSSTATKQLMLKELPPVLTIALKRFGRTTFGLRKIDTKVEFPYKLDLSPFVINDDSANQCFTYYLSGISSHGGGMGGGHYVACVHHAPENEDGDWYYFSDSHRAASSLENTLSSQAYVLFYKRADTVVQR